MLVDVVVVVEVWIVGVSVCVDARVEVWGMWWH